MSGVCTVCGCTDLDACEGGCRWVDRGHTLCSSCSVLSVAAMLRRRGEAIIELRLRRNMHCEQMTFLERRMKLLLNLPSVTPSRLSRPRRRARRSSPADGDR